MITITKYRILNEYGYIETTSLEEVLDKEYIIITEEVLEEEFNLIVEE